MEFEEQKFKFCVRFHFFSWSTVMNLMSIVSKYLLHAVFRLDVSSFFFYDACLFSILCSADLPKGGENREKVKEAEMLERQKSAAAAAQRRAQEKASREKQLQQAIERKQAAQKKAQKVERRRWLLSTRLSSFHSDCPCAFLQLVSPMASGSICARFVYIICRRFIILFVDCYVHRTVTVCYPCYWHNL